MRKGGEPGRPEPEVPMEIDRTGSTEMAGRFRGLPTRCLAGVEVPVAESFLSRLLGLSHLDRDRAGPGLLIPRCSSVHTFGMRFPIDIHFLGDDDRLLRSFPATPPGRVVRCRGSRHVLELVGPGGENPRPGP